MRLLQAVAFVALFFIQVLPAATVAWQQTRRLADGRPIVLAVETRDPRDLFLGEYSTLTYQIGNLEGVEAVTAGLGTACDLSVHESCDLESGHKLYLRLAPDASGIDRPVQVQFEKPAKDAAFIAGTVSFGKLLRKGASLGRAACDRPVCIFARATYGIESWYDAQGRPALLDKVPRKDVLVDVRVDDDGVAALDEIKVGGRTYGKTARLWR